MEIFFYGVGIFCLFASIGANFYFLSLLKLVHVGMSDVSLELDFIKDSILKINDVVSYQSTRISSLEDSFEECLEEMKNKPAAEVRKNNWDSVREAFTRSSPKIKMKETI